MPRRIRRLSPIAKVLSTVLALAATGASAQTLSELYAAARGYDAAFLAAQASAQAAGHRIAQAESAGKAGATLDASASRTESDTPGRALTGTTAAGVSVNGRYPLYNRGTRVDIDRAGKGAEVARADVETAEQDLIVRLAQAYFDVLAAQDALATSQASKKAISEQLASAKRNFEVGTATITDTREAQARFDLATAQEIAAENDLRTKRIALDQLVGRQSVAPRALAVPVVLPAVQPAQAEEWVSMADLGHPLVRKARLGLEVASLDVAKSKVSYSPVVNAVGTAGTSYVPSTGGIPGLQAGTPSGLGVTARVGVEMSMPLYTGGRLQAVEKEVLALEDKARSDVEAARRAVAQGTRVAFFGVQSGMAQVKALEAAEASSKLALEATQLGYRVGVRVNLDVLNAQSQLYNTQRDLAKARYDVLVNGLKLRQASGQLRAQDLQNVDVLLAK